MARKWSPYGNENTAQRVFRFLGDLFTYIYLTVVFIAGIILMGIGIYKFIEYVI